MTLRCADPRCPWEREHLERRLKASFTRERFHLEAERLGMHVLAGRVGEAGAAALLGMSHKRLKAKRLAGEGPDFVRVGVNPGERLSYELDALATWYDAGCRRPRTPLNIPQRPIR